MPPGTDAASMYLARRLPYLWDTTRGALSLDDLKEHATDFFAAKTGGAQASLALRELDDVLKTLDGKTIESFDAKVYLEAANPAFDTVLAGTRQGIADPEGYRHGHRHEPGHHRSGHRVRRQVRHPVGGRRLLGEVQERRAAEGEGGIDREPGNAAQRVAGDAQDDRRRRRATQLVEGGREGSVGQGAVRLQAGLPLADRAGDPRAEGQERQVGVHQGRDEQSRPDEEVPVLRSPEPLAARALSGRRDLRARARRCRRRTSRWSSSTTRRTPTRSKRRTRPARSSTRPRSARSGSSASISRSSPAGRASR